MDGCTGSFMLLTVLAGAVIVGGCAKRATMPPPSSGTTGQVQPQNPQERADRLRRMSDEFSAAAAQLPGRSDEQHRQAAALALRQAVAVLGVLAPSDMGLGFGQQLQIVGSSADELARQGALGPEPAVDTAVRTLHGALSALMQRAYADQPRIVEALADLNAQLPELDAARGAIHQLLAAKAIQRIAQIVQQMTDVEIQRLALSTGAAPATSGATTLPHPSDGPATVPVTNPVREAAASE